MEGKIGSIQEAIVFRPVEENLAASTRGHRLQALSNPAWKFLSSSSNEIDLATIRH